MPSISDTDIAFAIGQEPEQAIDFFRKKGFSIGFRWQDVWAESQAKAFTAAGAMKLDILKDIRGAVDTALAEGQTLEQFKKELVPKLKKKGWWGKEVEVVDKQTGEVRTTRVDPWRMRTIYQTNLQSAYNAGRWKAQIEDDNRPYFHYVAVLDGVTRQSHRELNNTVLPKDDPFWDVNYPPNGWGCRCRVRALTERGLERKNLNVQDKSPGDIADDAFAFNNGKNGIPDDVAAWEKAQQVSESARENWIADMQRPETRQRVWDGLVDDAAAGNVNGRVRTMGYLKNELFNQVNADNAFASPIMVANDRTVADTLNQMPANDVKQATGFNNYEPRINPDRTTLHFIERRDNKIIDHQFQPAAGTGNGNVQITYTGTTEINENQLSNLNQLN